MWLGGGEGCGRYPEHCLQHRLFFWGGGGWVGGILLFFGGGWGAGWGGMAIFGGIGHLQVFEVTFKLTIFSGLSKFSVFFGVL